MRVSTTRQDDGSFLANYQLPVGDEALDMTPIIGQPISVKHSGVIHCVHCASKTKKSFNQGYCYRCLIKLAQCDTCIIKPELCHYAQGTCREPQWGEANCLSDHFVYLSNTGALKIGITRHVTDGVSSRWIDQGASQALPILRVSERLISGLVETAAKGHIGDKTNWRTMLKGQPEPQDIQARAEHILGSLSEDIETIIQQHGLQSVQPVESEPVRIDYPVITYPDKVKSINLDKTPEFSGTLLGIKGQYLLLNGDRVINMRKYAGYELEVSA
ncbi:DUF2797 domain-containing protein [Alteromonas sp. SM 2104]|nr:DUF2797 domain-containing protein [Alteromonas oceanisediminis]MBT0587749.1 DUF2797 domain-containing protein [Alteromonas oceanisediminis]